MTQSARMDPSLWAFLSRFRDSTDAYNFVGQCIPYTGKFRIERNDLESFWELYCSTLSSYNQAQDQGSGEIFLSGISERYHEYLPLLVDVDLEAKIDSKRDPKERLYTLEQVKVVASVYRKVLKEICREYKARNTACFILEKPAPYVSGDKVKGGFHLHFPRMWIRNCDHDLHIYPRVKRILTDEHPNLFSRIGGAEDTGQFLDGKVCSKFWILYGGCKSEHSGSYRLTTVLDQDGDEAKISEVMDGWKIYDAFDQPITISNDKWEYFLPRILSIHPANRDRDIVQLRSNLEWASEIKLSTAKERTIKHENINVNEAVALAKELMPMVAAWRSDKHDDWMQMGFCLYDIGDGTQEAFDLWLEFTGKSDRPSRDEARCIYEWNQMTRRNCFTIGTLRHYASIDSPSEYEIWKKKKSGGHINEALNGGHTPIAEMLYESFASRFVCADPEKGIWYSFRNHRWHRIKKAIELRKKIKTTIVPQFIAEKIKVKREINDMEGDDQSDASGLKQKLNCIYKVLKNLTMAPFKDGVMREAVDLFHDEQTDFIELLDANINLLGFNNGVFDISTMTFREGRPEDYVSKTTGYDYEEFNDEHPRVLEVKDFFMKVFPDKELRRFFLEYAAQVLKGGNFNKVFLNMVGSGDNAKSVTIEFFEKTLGQYAVKFPTSLVTGKRGQSSAAAPEVIRSVGARFGSLQEPDKGEVINSGIIKEFTGNDSIFSRALFSDGREFKPMFKLAVITNKLLRLSGNDPAVWNRILVLAFEACFPKDSSKVPKTWEEQYDKKIFHRDPNFAEKLPGMRQPFMWLLIQILKEVFVKGASQTPEKVLSATDSYKQNNDSVLQFIKEYIIFDDKNRGLSITEVYSSFQQWFRENFPRFPVPDKNELKDDLNQRWGPQTTDLKWPGVRFRTQQDSFDDGTLFKIKIPDVEEKVIVKEEKYAEKPVESISLISNISYSASRIPKPHPKPQRIEEDIEEDMEENSEDEYSDHEDARPDKRLLPNPVRHS
jgi:P4 family phage/plasmid primase-like protien